MKTNRGNRLLPMKSVHVVPQLPKQGMTLLAFLGRGTNIRPFYGAAGQRYMFGGPKHLTGYVYDGDVATLLAMRENAMPLFESTKTLKVAIPAVKPAPVVVTSERQIPVPPPMDEVSPVKKARPKKAKSE